MDEIIPFGWTLEKYMAMRDVLFDALIECIENNLPYSSLFGNWTYNYKG